MTEYLRFKKIWILTPFIQIKNIFFVDTIELLKQIFYTGFIFGPIMCLITYKTKTIWIASVLHYLNNSIAFLMVYNAGI